MNSVLVRRLFSLVAVPFVLAACEDPTGPRPAPRGLEIRPTADVFPITTVDGRRRVTMAVVIENDSDRTVYYGYCGESVSKRVGSEWTNVWRPVCASVAIPPEPIAPGASKEITLNFIEHPEIDPGFPFDDPVAMYRLEATLFLKSGERFRVIEGTEIGGFAIRN